MHWVGQIKGEERNSGLGRNLSLFECNAQVPAGYRIFYMWIARQKIERLSLIPSPEYCDSSQSPLHDFVPLCPFVLAAQ